MSEQTIHFAKAINGNIVFNDPLQIKAILSRLQNIDIEVTLQKRRNRSKAGSTAQLRYYFGIICRRISDFNGDTVDDIDMQLRMMFHSKIISGIRIPRSLKNSNCNTVDREMFFIQCRQWASEFLNLWIEKPNETKEYFYNVD